MSVTQSIGVLCVGTTGQIVEVQVHVSPGLPRTTIVGLPDTAVSESRDRVRSALVNSGFRWPDQRITIGLSPAAEQKRGSALDLTIAVALLGASGQLSPSALVGAGFVGELGLDGSLRPVAGTVAMATALARRLPGLRTFVPARCSGPWSLVPEIRAVPAESLREVVRMLCAEVPLPAAPPQPPAIDPGINHELAEVRGQHRACQALEIAAAGGHHLLLSGPPGVGKTMIGRRLPDILPDLTREEITEVAAIQEVAVPGTLELSSRPPMRVPHHSASHVAMVGGAAGAHVRPGLISQAHRGVLLLDEAPEFRRETLEALRQPLEEGQITVARAGVVVRLPAGFQLVMTQNPCPCGEADNPAGDCRCTRLARRRYQQRLSGPLLDRVDLRVRVPPRSGDLPYDGSESVRERVVLARDRASGRLGDVGARRNADVSGRVVRRDWSWSSAAVDFLNAEQLRAGASTRAIEKVARLSWTIADLAGHARPSIDDVAMACDLRGERP